MIKQKLKPFTPKIVRKIYRGATNYFKRLWRWLVILKQIRGVTFLDQMKLVFSALLSPITSLKSLLKWQNPVLLFDTGVYVKGNGTFNVRKYTDDLWHILPNREANVYKCIKERLTIGSVFVDAGANIGVYSILASSIVGDEGKVISIEMIPLTIKRLKKHIMMNNQQNINIIEQALSDTKDETIVANVPNNKYGMASIEIIHNGIETESVKVMTTTLSHVLANVDKVDLMKMDIEGAELKALQGGEDVLDKVENIIFETHTQLAEISSFLTLHGFKLMKLSGRDVLAYK